jgi:hypothetical protein
VHYESNHDPRDQSDFIGELGDAIRQNPVPAALVGAGILWLFMGKRDFTLGATARSFLETAGEGARKGARGVSRGAHYAGAQASAGVGRITESVAHLGSQISDGVAGAAGAVSGVATNVAEQATHVANETVERVWSSGGDTQSEDSFEGRGASVATRLQNSLSDLFSQQPLLLGAVGLAIGAGIAASVPRSQAEARLIGPTADAARKRGEALWREAKKRGTEIASRGLEEAEAQGLTPKAAADVARTVASKVAGVTEKAGKDIVDRIKD